MQQTPDPEYLERLAGFASGLRLEDLPEPVLDRGRWIVADSIGAIAAGMQIEEMRRFVERLLASKPQGVSSVIGAGVRADAGSAAMLNGTAGTWLEMDEGNLHAKGHPGIQVVPAAVAVAQQIGASGRDLLLAVIAGYEVSARISLGTRTRLAVHPHGTYGAIGAAVAVARLMGYDRNRMLQAINVASSLGLATSRRTLLEGATVRNVYTGTSGFMGVLAHQMIESGFTGESDGVGSVYGHVYADDFDRDRVVAGLGEEFIIARNYFKLHSCGRYVHSALDLASEVMARQPGGRLDPDDVEAIAFRAYHMAATLAQQSVSTSFGARFSVPFAVASLIRHGGPGLENYGEEAVADPVVQSLARRVTIEEEPSYTAQYPARQMCDITVRLRDGTVIEAAADRLKGEAENPHSVEEMTAKFESLAGPVWGRERARELLDGLNALQDIPDMAAFLESRQI